MVVYEHKYENDNSLMCLTTDVQKKLLKDIVDEYLVSISATDKQREEMKKMFFIYTTLDINFDEQKLE